VSHQMSFFKSIINKIKSLFTKPSQAPQTIPEAPKESPDEPEAIIRGSLKWYETMYSQAYLSDNRKISSRREWYVNHLISNIDKYKAVELKTGVPWFLIGAIHGLEASFDLKTCLHNGDPLGRKTVNVPAGRGPFFTWEQAAIDALEYEGAKKITDWSLGQCLYFAERYNGTGYFKRGLMSPYLWSCTSKYSGYGKYVRDHVYDPNAQDEQCGVAAMIKRLEQLGYVSFTV